MPDENNPTLDDAVPADERSRSISIRSQRIGIALTIVVIAVLGLAVGAGISPRDVTEAVQQRLYGDPDPDFGQARTVTSDRSGTISIEVLLAPADRGPGECVIGQTNWRGSTADGSTGVAGQMVRCWFDGPAVAWTDPKFRIVKPSDRFGFVMEMPIGPIGGGAVALVGGVYEDVESIMVDFGDGSEYTFNVVTADGWFAAILPDGVADIDRLDGTLVNKVVSLKLIDIEGRVLATIAPETVGP